MQQLTVAAGFLSPSSGALEPGGGFFKDALLDEVRFRGEEDEGDGSACRRFLLARVAGRLALATGDAKLAAA